VGRDVSSEPARILEQGGHGRLLVYDPAADKTTTLVDGLNFANGVAVAHDESSSSRLACIGCSATGSPDPSAAAPSR
jgi:Strictosidine synthase